MSGQRYKRTNFEEDDVSNGGTPTIDFNPSIVLFKGGLTAWQRKTLLERLLIALCIILSITVIILAILIAVKQAQVKVLKNKSDYCLSPACVTVASSVLNSMDTSVNPCADFFHYSCGGWIKDHPIPSGHSRWGTFSVLWKENQAVMKHVLEKPLNTSDSEAIRKAKLYYRSCMDKNKTTEKLGSKPLLQLISSLGGWSISNTTSTIWNELDWNFQSLLHKIHLLSINALFAVWVSEDDKNSSRNILQIDQAGLTLPNANLYLNKSISEDEILSAYLNYMTVIGILLGGSKNDTMEQMKEVIDFETAIASITIPGEERRDEEKIYHKMTIQKLQTLIPFINWIEYFNTTMNAVNIKINQSEEIVVYTPEFLKSLSDLVTSYMQNSTGKRILNNYLIWHIVQSLSQLLSKPFREAEKVFSNVILGTTGSIEKWRMCVKSTDGVLGFALGAMFVKEVFKGDSKKRAEEMVKEIKTAFKNSLPSLAWMDDETRKAATEKANAIVDMIGFPNYIMNDTQLDKLYSKLMVNESEYFENNIRTSKFALLKDLEKLREKPERNSWVMTPQTVNAYYTSTKNEIVFPAGILQAPFYDRDYPKSLNFGAMGVVIGHELTHGFDDQGREFDKYGNLRPWWNNRSISQFQNQTDCMVKQYSSYSLNGENINGKNTLGENIADNGGLKSAFYAYENWMKKNGPEKPLPALGLTHRQLFFLGFAQVWCSTATKEAAHIQLLNDPHSPAKYRVIGTLSNSYEFAREFNCPAESPMNPIKKCVVW